MKNEHEITKLMLETMRAKSSEHKNLIRENEEFGTDAPVVDTEGADEGGQPMSDLEKEYLPKEKEKFHKKINNGVVINDFAIDPETRNVSISGNLRSGLEWSYSTDGGVQIGTAVGNRFITLNKDGLQDLNVLLNNYELWLEEWDRLFNTEIKPDNV